jgi:type III secretion protein L
MNPENLIKQAKLPHRSLTSGGVVKRPLITARAEAKEIVARAAAEAEAIRREAERAAHEVRENAYQEGYSTGLAELNRHLLDARVARDRLLAEAEPEILRLAVRIAEKIIGRELERNQAIVDIVKTALRQAQQSRTVTIRFNPADLPVIQAGRDRVGRSDPNRFVERVAVSQIGSGGCLIETESGSIDARLETQFRILEDALLSLLETKSPQTSLHDTEDTEI